jgi:mRNA-degrading endonuclease toxin of MazEF toxin-antitoxin module
MKRGDVIVCTFPHAGGTPPKNRPGLVVQSDFYNQKIANLLIAAITSNLKNAGDDAHYLIDVSTPEGQQSGLNWNSLVSCINLAVIPSSTVSAKIGSLSADACDEAD